MTREHEIQIDEVRSITLRVNDGALTLAVEDPGAVAIVEVTPDQLDELASHGHVFAGWARHEAVAR